MPLERYPLNVSKLVGDAAEAMRANADAAGLVYEVRTTPEALFVEGDLVAICRKIVDQLGGTIGVTSVTANSVASEFGTGTTFIVEFPELPRPAVSKDTK
jgi:hypothetical protein